MSMLPPTTWRHVTFAPFVGSSRSPYAGHQFLHHYLQELAGFGWEVTLVAPNWATVESDRRSYAVRLVSTSRPGVGRRGLLRLVASLQDGAPLPSLGNPQIATLLASADSLEVQWSPWLGLVTGLKAARPDVPVIALAHDLLSESRASALRTGLAPRGLSAARPFLSYRRKQELALLARCDVAVLFKDSDADLVRMQRPAGAVVVASPWLDRPEHDWPPPGVGMVLFVAAFDRPENDASARWFLDEVWPRVVEDRPDCRVVLAGGGPSDWLKSRRSPTISITGFVAELSSYYREATVVVAPIRSGAGLKFKVPQAMAFGRPVVATSLAVQGLSMPPDTIVGVADNPAVFAELVGRCLDDAALADRVGRSGAAWVAERFNFLDHVKVIADLLQHCASERAAR